MGQFSGFAALTLAVTQPSLPFCSSFHKGRGDGKATDYASRAIFRFLSSYANFVKLKLECAEKQDLTTHSSVGVLPLPLGKAGPHPTPPFFQQNCWR